MEGAERFGGRGKLAGAEGREKGKTKGLGEKRGGKSGIDRLEVLA